MIPSSIWHAVVTMYVEYTPCSKLIYYKYVFYRLINTNIVTITMNADIGSYKVNPCEQFSSGSVQAGYQCLAYQ